MDSDTSRSMINLCDAAAAQDPLPVDAPPAVVSSSVAVKPEPLPEDYFKDVKFDVFPRNNLRHAVSYDAP